MAYGLCEPRLIDGIVVVIGIRKWAFFHEDFTAVGQPETSLVDVLMIVEWTRTHHKNEVVRFPTFFEYRSSDIAEDRKSTRLNSSHVKISYAVFCLKKK